MLFSKSTIVGHLVLFAALSVAHAQYVIRAPVDGLDAPVAQVSFLPSPGLALNSDTVVANYGLQTIRSTTEPTAITIRNSGQAPASVETVYVASSAHFALEEQNCEKTLAPGDECEVSVSFNPKALGVLSSVLRARLESGEEFAITSLRGTGVQGVVSFNVSASTPNIRPSAAGVPSTPLVVGISNTGQGVLTLQSITIPSPGIFEIVSSTCQAILAAGQACSASVRATVPDGNLYSALLVVNADGTLTPTNRVQLSAQVSTSVEPTLSTGSVSFGEVATNTTQTRQVLLTNPSSEPITLTSTPAVLGDSAFTATVTSCGVTLAAGASCVTEVAFSPVASGMQTATVRFSVQGLSTDLSVALTGTGVNPVTLFNATLPSATVGQSYSYDFKQLLGVSNEKSPDRSLATWSVLDTLPGGLSLNSTSGLLSGTPTTAGTSADFTVVATYKNNEGRQVYRLIVSSALLLATQVSAGSTHTCAVTTSGGAKCWGRNTAGQLGDGSSTDRLTPVDVVGLTSGVESISAVNGHTCAVTTSGGAKCWGFNGDGQLGNGSTTSSSIPVDVSGLTSGVASISTGSNHTCAVTTSGGAKCWGSRNGGRLGYFSATDRLTPGDVSGLSSGVVSISVGFQHTCAVTTSGGAKCWGDNAFGQLGNGSTTSSSTPVDVSGLTSGVASISTGSDHSCAVTTSGGAKCWGSNWAGQVGDGNAIDRLTPVDVVGLASGVASISAGGSHSCARTTSGGAKCWGSNGNGQLGDGSGANRQTPQDVSGLTSGVASLSAGNSHTCAVASSGGAKCWGSGSSGQRGDGTTIGTRRTPVDVRD